MKDTFRFFSAEKSTAEFVDLLRRFYGPTMNAFDAARANGNEDELRRQLLALAEAQNTSSDGSVSIPATYLRVTVRV